MTLSALVLDTVTDLVMWVAAVENIHNGWGMDNMWIPGLMCVQGARQGHSGYRSLCQGCSMRQQNVAVSLNTKVGQENGKWARMGQNMQVKMGKNTRSI